MRNILKMLISFVLFASFVSCATQLSIIQPPSVTSTGPRTIIIEKDTISEKDVGEFTSWYCKDFINGGPTLVEVGYVNNPDIEFIGFVLYDGGYSGEVAIYRRTGLEHRWDWGPEGVYSFVLKQDGTGAYYDFSAMPEGESTKPNSIFKCQKR